jgi:FkbM family methyltransferase
VTITRSAALLARRLLPPAARRRLRRTMFEWLDLTWTTPSGIALRVASYNEWVIYNEIFVDGEYDTAIDAALRGAAGDRPIRVVDVGANVGFFTLRVFDRLRAEGGEDSGCLATLIEANPALIPTLAARLEQSGLAPDRAQVIAGAAGGASPGVSFYPAADDPGGSSTVAIGGRRRIVVPAADLEKATADAATIDLLKCDVEGGELDVIERHPSVFARTRIAVFEFHHDLSDVDRARARLAAAGLARETIVRSRGGLSIRVFERVDP